MINSTTKRGEKSMTNILEYLETSVLKYPNKTAVIKEGTSLTYKQLLENSEKIGSFIIQKTNICKPIIIFNEKGTEALCCFFGTVYAGCFYTLISPTLPDTRIKQIQNILKSTIVLTDNNNYKTASALFPNLEIFTYEEMLKEQTNHYLLYKIRKKCIDTMPLYINFTSGSTGIPKGVTVSHRNVIDFIDTFCSTFCISHNDIIGNQAPFDFDVSVKDIYASICSGATLVIIPKEYFSKPTQLMDYIIDNKINTLIWAVSALSLINTFHTLDYKTPSLLKYVFFSGEVMPLKHLKDWQEHLPNTMFVNLYGPTEITCNCTYYIVDNYKKYDNSIPIGKAFPNENVFLLSENNEEINDTDVIGEICVSGAGVSLGYFNDKEQTRRSFIQNPLNDDFFDIIYKTGDLGKYDENGNLVFCGRKDYQIKYMGHRIELEEIEKAIMNIPKVDSCCCVFDSDRKKLYAFYVGNIDKKELHKKLRERLPVYMIPNALRKISSIPLTENGKANRKLLLRERL